MIRGWCVVTVAILLSGCLGQPDIGEPVGIEEPEGAPTLPWSAPWQSDLLFRFEVEASAGATCLIAYEFSGHGGESGEFFHAVVQNGDGALISWNLDSEFAPGDAPSGEIGLGGQEVMTGDSSSYDYWAVSRNSNITTDDGVLIVTFAARNLDFWPEGREGYTFTGPEPSAQTNRTALVDVSCDDDWSINQLSITRNVTFFDTSSFDGVANFALWTESADEPVVSGVGFGSYAVEMEAKDVIVLATIDSAPSVARLALAHPTGSESWTFDPTVNAFAVAPVAFVESTAGDYAFTLDWASGRDGRIMGFLGAR